MNNGVVISAKVRPFNYEGRVQKVVPEGMNLSEILKSNLPESMIEHAVVVVDGITIQPSIYSETIPEDGSIVTLNVLPAGGGGGKDIMRIVLTIAVIAISAGVGVWAAGGMTGFAAAATTAGVAAGVGMVGMLAVNALVPPASSKLSDLSGANSSESAAHNITGMRNAVRHYGVIPRVYGRRKYCPPYAAMPFSETQGDDSYFYLLFDFGYGELNLTDLRIGENEIGQFEGVEYKIHKNFIGQGLEIYRNATIQDDYSIRVKKAEPQIVETHDDADEIGIDIGFTGLAIYKNSGRKETSVEMKIEYCASDSDIWLPYDGSNGLKTITDSTSQQIRKGITIKPGSRGKWKVRVTRITEDSTSENTMDNFYIVALRSITYASPCNYDTPHTVVEMKIKATDQLNGMVDEFSAVATSVLPVWTGSEWVMQETRSPAWIYTDVLRGPANPKPVVDSRLNLSEIKAWADACFALAQDGYNYWTCDLIIDYRTTVFEMLRDVAATGRAAFSMKDGIFTVVRDKPQNVPVQLITPRNSWGFSSNKAFVDLPHAVKVRFIDPESNWQQGEVIVYDDGYNENNATRFEALELLGCTRHGQAWREGRFALATMRLRPEVFTVSMDIENLVCTRGDLVHVAHDVPCIGDHWARVKNVIIENNLVTEIAMDEPVVMEAGKNYVLRGRKADGECVSMAVQTNAGENIAVILKTPVDQNSAPAFGDLVVVGEENFEITPMIIKSIDAGPDFSAVLELIDAAPEIHNADTGEIPDYDPHMGKSVITEAPPAVVLDICQESEWNGEAYLSEFVLSWRMPQGKWAPAFEVYLKDVEGNWKLLDITSSTNFKYKNPVVGHAYEFLVRAVATGGKALPLVECAIASKTAVRDASIPATPINFTVEETSDGVRRFWWSMPEIPDDLDGYEIRYHYGYGASWENASRLSEKIVSKAPFETSAVMKGAHTFLIKAVDHAGNCSVQPAVRAFNLGEAPVQNIVQEVDFAGWSGVKTGCSVIDGGLLADDASGLMWASDVSGDSDVLDGESYLGASSPMWTDQNASMWQESFCAMEYLDSFVPAKNGLFFIDVEKSGQFDLLYRSRFNHLMWGESDICMWSSDDVLMYQDNPMWLPYSGAFKVHSGQNYELKAIIKGGKARGSISHLSAIIDVPDKQEKFDDISIPTEGARLLIMSKFEAIKHVSITLQDDGGSAATAKVIDKNVETGPLVKLFDTNGNAAGGLIDATIQGY